MASFFQPRRSKDDKVPQESQKAVTSCRERRGVPQRQPWRMCDEGCSGTRVWSRRTGNRAAHVPAHAQRTEASEQAGYRFGSPEPSLEVLQQRLQEVTEEEERLRTQLKDLEHQLAETCGADGEDYSHRKQRFKNHVDEVASTVRQLRQQRAQILEGTDPELQEEQRKRQEIRRFKTSSGYSTEAEIDERIHFLEQQMYDVSMQLLQEKRVLAEIQSLQRQREEVRRNRQLEAQLRSDEEIIRSRLEAIASQLKEKLQELQEANSDLAALEEERQETLSNSPLVVERSQVHHRLNECLQLKVQLERSTAQGLQARERAAEKKRREEEAKRREAEAKEEEAKELEEEEERRRFREERLERLRQERRRQHEEDQKHWQALQAQGTPQVAALPELPKEAPGSAEMRLLEQILVYCKKLLPKSNDFEEPKKPIEYNNPEGSLIIVPKEERSEEYLFAPPKPRRHEGKVRKRPPTSKLKRVNLPQQVLLHTPLSLRLFEELHIVPPVNTADVPATIDEVEERLQTHRKAAQLWELKRQELLEQKLQSELGKVREAQEERERERRRRLNMALQWIKGFEEEADQEEDGQKSTQHLQDLVAAAKSMGASDEQLSGPKTLLRRWRQRDAEAALREAIEAVEDDLEDDPPSTSEACKDLEDALRAAKEAALWEQHSELLEKAQAILEALKKESGGDGSSGEADTSADAEGDAMEEEATSATEGEGGRAEGEEEFVPKILNLDDDEELVFDLGMG